MAAVAKLKSETLDTSSKIKIGVLSGSENDNTEILKTSRTKAVRQTPFGKPSDDLITGRVEGVECAFLSRRGRKNEIMPSNINYRANIWALKEEGCTHILATAVAQILDPQIKKGDLLVLKNVIDLTDGRQYTFYDGEKNHPRGSCFMPAEPPFCETTRRIIIESAKQVEVPVIDGKTLIVLEGPRLSTNLENDLYRKWGADVYNMTLMPEVILAKELGLCYAVVILATDYISDRDDASKGVKKQIANVSKLLTRVIKNMNRENWNQIFENLQSLIQSSIIE